MNHRNPAPTVDAVSRLIDEFNKLPGIGPKTAQRLAYFLLRMPETYARALSDAIVEVKEKVTLCSRCFNITETDPCPICTSENRDSTRVCVVEEPLDVLAIERTREYRGVYHVLHGALSPQNAIGPDDLKISELVARVRAGGIDEVIIATNPNQLGTATLYYIHKQLAPTGVRVTALARGLPNGGDLEYADDVTLGRAIANRQDLG